MDVEPSAWARELVATALGRALDEVASTGGPLPPSSLHRRDDGDVLTRYRAETLEDALRAAREELTTCPDEAWVLVWDGYITIDEWRTDAVYAHLEERGAAQAHLFAWRYGLTEGREIGPLGAAMYLGTDGRYDSPERSHPLPAGEGPTAPHGQVMPRRRWRRRKR